MCSVAKSQPWPTVPEHLRVRANSEAITWMIRPTRRRNISRNNLGSVRMNIARYTRISWKWIYRNKSNREKYQKWKHKNNTIHQRNYEDATDHWKESTKYIFKYLEGNLARQGWKDILAWPLLTWVSMAVLLSSPQASWMMAASSSGGSGLKHKPKGQGQIQIQVQILRGKLSTRHELIVASWHYKESRMWMNIDSVNGLLPDGTKP